MAVIEEFQKDGDDWVELEIARELDAITIEELEIEGKEQNGNEIEVSSSPPLAITVLQTYLSLRANQKLEIAEELNTLYKEHGINTSKSSDHIEVPPSSQSLYSSNGNENKEEEEMNNSYNEQTEMILKQLREDQIKLELIQNKLEEEKRDKEATAVTIIQAHWRGYRIRSQLSLEKEILTKLKRSISAAIIQSSWKHYLINKDIATRKAAVQCIYSFWKRERQRRMAILVLMAGKRQLAVRKIQIQWKRYRRKKLVHCIQEIGKKEKERKEIEIKKQEFEKKELERQEKERQKIEKERKELELKKQEIAKKEKEKQELEVQKIEMEKNQLKKQQFEKKEKERKEVELKRIKIEKEEFEKQQIEQERRETSENHSSHDIISQDDELAQMYALKEIRSQEELSAQHSRERMSQLFSYESLIDVAMETRQSVDYKARLEHASVPYSPHAWVGVVNERIKEWQDSLNKIKLPKPPPLPLLPSVRPVSTTAKPLSDAQLLASSPQGTPLDKVQVVYVFRNRSNCINFKCLSRCPDLRILSLIKCSLITVNDIIIGDNNIQELSLASNKLELVDFSKLINLRFLDLSDNHLSSIHGLQFCKSLLELNMNDNRVARIGGLNGCGLLQKLTLNSNLIINSTGVVSLPRLQHLSISENHLPLVLGIDGCSLLQCIELEQNNLQECISLTNHVLLRELNITGNSLSDIGPIEEAWLPHLHILTLSNNCVSKITSLTCCVSLSTFDIRHNSLYDFPLFLQCLKGCYKLTNLYIDGNPITHEPKYKNHLMKVLPSLQKLDNIELKKKRKSLSSTSSSNIPDVICSHPLMKLVSIQVQQQNEMKDKQQTLLDELSSHSSSSATMIKALDLKVSHCIEYDKLLQRHYKEHVHYNGYYHVIEEKKITKRDHEAIIIQSHWRGYRERVHYKRTLHSIITIQCHWRGYLIRKKYKEHLYKLQYTAAVIIQSHYRGYRLRKRLATLLKLSNKEKEENDDIIEFDENFIESFEREEEEEMRPFSPTDDEINNLFKCSSPFSSPPSFHSPPPLPSVPTFSLPGAIQEEIPSQTISSLSSCDSHVITSSPVRNAPPPPPSKKKLIMDEWGFTNQKTAQLMMKRVSRHTKLEQTSHDRTRLQDPYQRLAQFNNNNKTQQFKNKSDSPTKYQWSNEKRVIHRQLIERETVKGNSSSSSTLGSSLPQMELHVLVGHTPRLITSKAQNEVVKQSSSSSTTKLHGSNTSIIKQAWN